MDNRELVRGLLREDRAEGDVLRVLAMSLGSIWLSELVNEVNAFNVSLGIDRNYSSKEIFKAVKNLERAGLVEIREGIKAVLGLSDGIKDYLISVKDIADIIPVIVTDEKYVRYKLLLKEYLGVE